MTVNEMLAELRKLQRAGRGDNTVYQHTPGEKFCMPVEQVNTHHTTSTGHVVLRGVDPSKMRD